MSERWTMYDMAKGTGREALENQFGLSNALTSTGMFDIWQGLGTNNMAYYDTATVAALVGLTTTDGTAGSGMQELKVEGLDANWAVATETVILAGTTSVLLANTYRRIIRMTGKETGSLGTADGLLAVIGVDASMSQSIMAVIPAGFNDSRMTHYTVPAGKKLYLASAYVETDGANQDVRAKLVAREFGTTSFNTKWESLHYRTSVSYPDIWAVSCPEKTDIVWRGQTLGAGAGVEVSVKYDFVLEDA